MAVNGRYGFVDQSFPTASTDSSVKAEAMLSLYQAGREEARAAMWWLGLSNWNFTSASYWAMCLNTSIQQCVHYFSNGPNNRMVLGNLLWVVAWEGFDRMVSIGSFQPEPFWDSISLGRIPKTLSAFPILSLDGWKWQNNIIFFLKLTTHNSDRNCYSSVGLFSKFSSLWGKLKLIHGESASACVEY